MRTTIGAALLVAGALGRCVPTMAHVAHGDAFVTGKPTYDQFFAKVRVVRAEGLDCAGTERASHAGLVKALALTENSPTDLVVKQASARAKKLRERGAHLHLEITPEPRLIVARTRGELGADGDALVKALEDAARSTLEVRKQLATVAARATELSAQRMQLRAEAPSAFRALPLVQSNEVLFELDAAEGVLADAAEAANRYASAASWFVVELAQAIETGAAGVSPTIHASTAPHEPPPAPAIKHPLVPPPAAPIPTPPVATPASPPPPPQRNRAVDDFEP
jgi:hypothetical protein